MSATSVSPASSSSLGLLWAVAARVLGLVMVWFGWMRFQAFSVVAMEKLLGQYAWLPEPAHAAAVSHAVGALQLAIGVVLLLAPAGAVRRGAGLAAALFWGWGLLLLLGTPMYVHNEMYSGFPVIGGGQTLLKHLGIAALGLGIFAYPRKPALYAAALIGLWLGQLLVLVWIGGMKFTHVEAIGIEGLMRSNALFSWLYELTDVQGASIIIGVTELLTAALIALWPWRPQLARWGLLAALATYILTNTFMLSLPGWQAEMGFPYIGGTGQFLVKDQLLLLGALVLLMSPLRRSPAPR